MTKRKLPGTEIAQAIKRARKAAFVAKRAPKPSVTKNKFFHPESSGPELKYLDTSPNTALSTSGVQGNLVSMTQGTANGQRIGWKINIKSIEYDLEVSIATADLATVANYPTNSDMVKFALVVDKQCNGVGATYGDVFANTGTTGFAEFRNIANRDRFDVLAVERINLNSSMSNAERIHRFVKVNIPVMYNSGNAGTIADISSNNIFWTAIDENSVGTHSAVLFGKIRVHYADE